MAAAEFYQSYSEIPVAETTALALLARYLGRNLQEAFTSGAR